MLHHTFNKVKHFKLAVAHCFRCTNVGKYHATSSLVFTLPVIKVEENKFDFLSFCRMMSFSGSCCRIFGVRVPCYIRLSERWTPQRFRLTAKVAHKIFLLQFNNAVFGLHGGEPCSSNNHKPSSRVLESWARHPAQARGSITLQPHISLKVGKAFKTLYSL